MLKEKLNKLEEILNGYGSMVVALSGGVDSMFLLTFAHKLWGDDRVSAMTATGPYFAEDEVNYATQVCQRLGISMKKADVSHVMELVKENPEDRCYHCKTAIFTPLKAKADMAGKVLADGTNADDMMDYRPGYKAILELGIASPLKEAGLTKAEIRHGLHQLAEEDPAVEKALIMDEKDMTIWNKPAFACLASRIPYGEMLTVEKLKSIYDGEVFLRDEGFKQLRVRCHELLGAEGKYMARIELLPEDMARFTTGEMMRKTEEKLKSMGFEFVTLDLGGYAKGKMNTLVDSEQLEAVQEVMTRG